MSDSGYNDADMSATYEAGVEQGHADMVHIVAECSRYKEALEQIADENRVAYTAITAKTFVAIARKALQEAEG